MRRTFPVILLSAACFASLVARAAAEAATYYLAQAQVTPPGNVSLPDLTSLGASGACYLILTWVFAQLKALQETQRREFLEELKANREERAAERKEFREELRLNRETTSRLIAAVDTLTAQNTVRTDRP